MEDHIFQRTGNCPSTSPEPWLLRMGNYLKISQRSTKPLGSLAREAICVMLEKEKAAIQEWRKAHLEAAE